MKKRNKIITLILTGIVGAAVVAGITGCNKGIFNHSPEKKAQWIVEEVSEELALTDVQLQKLEAIKEHILALRKEFKEKHESTHKEVMDILSKPTLDQARLNAMVTQKTDTVNETAPEIIALFAGFYDTLDAEQQQKLRKAIEKHKSRHHHHG